MKIQTRFYTLLAGLLVAGYCTSAQTADELIAKNIAAMGGEEKLKGIKSQYMEGTMQAQGQSIPIKRWVKQDEAMRLEFVVNNSSNVQVITRNRGWTLMPVMQQTTPQDMEPALVKLMKSQLDLRGELYDYKSKGRKVEVLGKEDVNGAPAWKLKITTADGTNGIAYLDAQTYLLVKTTNHTSIEGRETDLVTTLSDYKKTPEGLAYPGVTEQQPGGVKISVLKVQTNEPVSDSLFSKPKE
ncbi:LolA family protein [Chitinophaga arvensicola]|uniref:Outer membrane lipoprotein-sorting protein n=1 Tax=Chitinophaga arvensicola TaxID=29529 RepID=A0A1I0NHB6_9BACT|nr:hypothetical protein [Chitinophaga arvensicola]SEW00683.1 hypothetical protein SAMN04488122_0169 [Chitinophaga arvensicola]